MALILALRSLTSVSISGPTLALVVGGEIICGPCPRPRPGRRREIGGGLDALSTVSGGGVFGTRQPASTPRARGTAASAPDFLWRGVFRENLQVGQQLRPRPAAGASLERTRRRRRS
jgi:hypothetical protein